MSARRPTIVATLIVGAVLAAGCGGSDESTDGSTATSAPTPTSSSAAPATTSPAVESTTPTTEPAASTTVPPTTAPPTTAPPTTEPAPPQKAPSIRSLIDAGTIWNLAHAGGDQAAPHSTPFAYAEAVKGGANALELDVQLTADGVLVVQHDDTVDKTTESTGPVGDLTLDEIQALDNAYWFSPECWPCHDRPVEEYIYRGVRTGAVPPPPGYEADDFKVPTFSEIATAHPTLPLDIEIKGAFPEALLVAEQLAAELIDLDREDSVVVVSFDDEVVDAFHDLAPNVSLSPGLGRLTEWFLNGTPLDPHFEVLQLPPFQADIEVINADIVTRIHAEGRIVWVWPNDASEQENAEFYGSLLDDGVDGIIAGRPAVMTEAVGG